MTNYCFEKSHKEKCRITQLGNQKLIRKIFGSAQEERKSKTKLVALGEIRNLI